MAPHPPQRKRVLFVCVHNSGRSQMAEAFLRHLEGDAVDVRSAGLEAGTLNADVVRVMAEAGIDISRSPVKSVFDAAIADQSFDFVITVCDERAAQRCPSFPGAYRRELWDLPDPAGVAGLENDRIVAVRTIRDLVRANVEDFRRRELRERARR